MSSRGRAATVVAMLLPFAAPLAAQLRLGLEAAHLTYSSSITFALEPGVEATIGPGNANRVGAWASTGLGRGRLVLLVARASGPLASGLGEGAELLTGDFGFTAWTLMPSLGWPLVSTAGGASLWLQGGPSLDVWGFDGPDSRVLLSVALAATVEAPLGRELALVARVEGSTGPSVLGEEFDEPGTDRHAGRRLAVGLGLAWLPGGAPGP